MRQKFDKFHGVSGASRFSCTAGGAGGGRGRDGEGGRFRGWFKNGEDRFRSRRNSAEIFWRFLNSKIICGILILTLLFQEDWVEEV